MNIARHEHRTAGSSVQLTGALSLAAHRTRSS